MNIQRVELTSKRQKQLDYLDRMIFPVDDPYPKTNVIHQYWWLALNFTEGPIGFAGLELETRHGAFLCRAGVFQRYSGKGVHRKLILAREKFARNHGCQYVWTYCMAENIKSANNLMHMGYRLFKPSDPIKGALHFRKEL